MEMELFNILEALNVLGTIFDRKSEVNLKKQGKKRFCILKSMLTRGLKNIWQKNSRSIWKVIL